MINISSYYTQIFKKVGKAIGDFKMINKNDKIGVALSGGKDSLTLMLSLVRLKKRAPINFDIEIFIIDPGINEFDLKAKNLIAFVDRLKLKLNIIRTSIINVVFKIKKVKKPCFLCSRLRRGILYTELLKRKFNVLALGHHMDDFIETYFLNLFFAGKSYIMRPSYIAKRGIKVIRPLIYVKEQDIKNFADTSKLPVLKLNCGLKSKENLKRMQIKNLLTNIEQKSACKNKIKNSIFSALIEKERII